MNAGGVWIPACAGTAGSITSGGAGSTGSGVEPPKSFFLKKLNMDK